MLAPMRHFISPGLVLVSLLLLSAAHAQDKKPAAEARKVAVGKKNVSLVIEGDKRTVHVESLVCLREGALEQLLTRKGAKEHEAILAADVDARDIHQALLLARAEPGSPVVYQPKFKAPTGTRVKVFVRWEDKGKVRTEPAQKWVKNEQTGRALDSDWVFAGSRFVKNFDEGKPDVYLANDGDVICVANFEGALLDLPFNSSKVDTERTFVAFTERIPPKDTKVTLILEPVIEKRK